MKSHHEPYWDLVKRIIIESDVVLEILDARLVELSRNEEVEKLIKDVGRPVIFVINKSDLTDKKKLKKVVDELKEDGEVVFLSAKEPGSWKVLLGRIKQVFAKHGKREKVEKGKFAPKQKYREAYGEMVVGVLGYPNVGKSSIINQLAHKKKVPVSKKAGTTHGIHWIRASDEIKLIDSPGVIPLRKEDEVRYALIGARNADRLKDPDVVADAVINMFWKMDKNALAKHFDIDLENVSEYEEEVEKEVVGKDGKIELKKEKIIRADSYEVLELVANRKRYLIKGGEPDVNRASVLVIRDWQHGKLNL